MCTHILQCENISVVFPSISSHHGSLGLAHLRYAYSLWEISDANTQTLSEPLNLIRSLWCFGHMVVVGIGVPWLTPLPIAGWLALGYKQRVLMHGHQGWNVRHGLCHIYMIYVYIWVVYSFCLFCCLFIIVTTQFVALYKPCKPKPKPSTYDPPDNHPLAEIQIPILRPEPKQQICHQHPNTDHFGK